jgi:DNA-directed RNA polymerase subunit RPC12/RpoP
VSASQTDSDSDGIDCPHCGHRIRELWDYSWGKHTDIEIECPSCDTPILLSCRTEISYTAKAVPQ